MMSCLAGLTLRDEGVDAARVHMDAVIKHNSDLSKYGDVPFRLLARNDLLLAAADGSRPSLPFCPRQTHLKPRASIIFMADTGQSRNPDSHTDTALKLHKRIDSAGPNSVFSLGSFLLEKLQDVVSKLKINNADEFKRVLRNFPWTEHFSAKDCDPTWKEIEPEDESCL
ncbi:hypothetical protein BDV97DRAFT_421513 [Delphinella strobiligena]|nr:hypothetical protein BDV97DRAFT_421513 [Delphinella strobiligena]